MKTIADVYSKYKEWPDDSFSKCYFHRGNLVFAKPNEYSLSMEEVHTRKQFEKYKAAQESKVMPVIPQPNYDKNDINTWTKDQLVNTAIKVNNDEEGKAAVEFYESKGFTIWDGSIIKNSEYNSYVMSDDEGDILTWNDLGTHSLIEPILSTEDNTKQDSKVSWYDYDSGKQIGDPKYLEAVTYDNTKNEFLFLGFTSTGKYILETTSCNYENIRCVNNQATLKPLDHDKYNKKVAPMEWLVNSGIDCEFSVDEKSWFIGELIDVDVTFQDDSGEIWKHCRPRMNHKHVLTHEQYVLIPDCFVIETYETMRGEYIVEFTGLKDGYVFEHDV